jgi:hypothetical protein
VAKTINFAIMSKIKFPFQNVVFTKDIAKVNDKTSQQYVLLALANCFFAIARFDLWMFEGVYDVFTLMINFLNSDWQPKHVTISLFETIETIGQTLVRSLIELLDKWFKEKDHCLCER